MPVIVFSFDYDGPSILEVVSLDESIFDAHGGSRIGITGINFGVSLNSVVPHGVVLLGSQPCLELLFVGTVSENLAASACRRALNSSLVTVADF